MPGPHEVWLRVRIFTQAPNVNWEIWSYCRMTLLAVGGEEYVSRVRIRKEVEHGLSERVKMEVGIADSRGIMHAVPDFCSAKRPDLDS